VGESHAIAEASAQSKLTLVDETLVKAGPIMQILGFVEEEYVIRMVYSMLVKILKVHKHLLLAIYISPMIQKKLNHALVLLQNGHLQHRST
jgi:hypothetical protein